MIRFLLSIPLTIAYLRSMQRMTEVWHEEYDFDNVVDIRSKARGK